jgi:hypothetical protein
MLRLLDFGTGGFLGLWFLDGMVFGGEEKRFHFFLGNFYSCGFWRLILSHVSIQ